VTQTQIQDHLVDNLGLWREVLRPPPEGPQRPALFLDRDGVVVEDTGYLHEPSKVALISGAGAVITACNGAGTPVLAVTNQSGIGRGLYGWEAFVAVQTRLSSFLKGEGGMLDGVLACAFHAEGTGPFAIADHGWRKPRPGMLLAAAEVWPIDLARSWIVGDRASDLAAGKAAGLAGGLHVLTGHGAGDRSAAMEVADDSFEVLTADSVADHGTLLTRLGIA